MKHPARVELTIELGETAERIEGTVRSGAHPPLFFSGWSELFAALMTLISEPGEGVITPGRHQQPVQEPGTTT